MKNLHITKEISLPIDAVTQTLAAIGRKGSGKTYLATMIAEQMLDAGSQVIAIDPVGNWWGLRVGSDGKSKGKEIFVIGGEHGDVPIVPEAGSRIAKLLVEKSISAVLDISGFRLGERKRFCADFGEELLHLKKSKRTPVHIFIEEAQLIIPQRVGPEEARMVGAFEQIVRLGRNYGIGCTLVTQRPQSVNKEVLSQVECLCVLQVTGPHERKALEEWVQEAGADRELVGQLPSLERGEGYIWSPSWLRIYERVHFAKKHTFDASATPVVGKETKAALLSDIDVESIKKDMVDVIAQAEKDDPAVLHRKIKDLEKQLSTPQKTIVNPIVNKKEIEEAVTSALQNQAKDFKEERESWRSLVKHYNEIHIKILDLYSLSRKPEVYLANLEVKKLAPEIATERNISKTIPYTEARKEFGTYELSDKEKTFGKCARMIASYVYERGVKSKTQVAVATGYSQNSGGFNNAISELNASRIINRQGNMIIPNGNTLTSEITHDVDVSLEKWLSKLGACSRAIWKFLLENDIYDKKVVTFTKDHIASNTDYSVNSGGFNNSLSELSALGLIERMSGGLIRINPEILDL